jgi:hypothetical protein
MTVIKLQTMEYTRKSNLVTISVGWMNGYFRRNFQCFVGVKNRNHNYWLVNERLRLQSLKSSWHLETINRGVESSLIN